jgi:hypothetical protein
MTWVRNSGGSLLVPVGVANPYIYYPSFSKNNFPPQNGSGFWGAQSTIKEAVAPTIGTSASVANFAEFETQVTLGSREVNLTGTVSGGTGFSSTSIDVDVTDIHIKLNGNILRNLAIGSVSTPNQSARIRITGPGQLHYFAANNCDDLIIENCYVSGPGANNFALIVRAYGGGTSRRLAVHNVLARCGGYFYIGDATDTAFFNVTALTGEDLITPAEAWGIRHSTNAIGNHVMHKVDLRINPSRVSPNNHHNLRFHPSSGYEYIFLDDVTFVHRPTTQHVWVNASAGGGTLGTHVDALWIQNSRFHSDSGYPNMAIGDTNHARLLNNSVFSDGWTSDAQINYDPDPGTVAATVDPLTSGTTYAATGADPAYSALGNPSLVDWTI